MPKRAAEGGSDWAAGDSVLVNGRAAVVTKDMRPKHNRATVKWSDTGELQKKIDADSIQSSRPPAAAVGPVVLSFAWTGGPWSAGRQQGGLGGERA